MILRCLTVKHNKFIFPAMTDRPSRPNKAVRESPGSPRAQRRCGTKGETNSRTTHGDCTRGCTRSLEGQTKGRVVTKKKRMEKGHIAQRGERKYLVRWRGADGKQVSKVIRGDYAQALAYLAEQLKPKPPEPPKVPERALRASSKENGSNTRATTGKPRLRPRWVPWCPSTSHRSSRTRT